jgi:hypothetical protein
VAVGELPHGRDQDVVDHRREGRDADRTGQPFGEAGELAPGLGQLVLDALGVAGQDAAGGGERDPALGAVDERQPHLPLQLGELLGDRRGGEVEGLGRPHDAAAPRHLVQDP